MKAFKISTEKLESEILKIAEQYNMGTTFVNVSEHEKEVIDDQTVEYDPEIYFDYTRAPQEAIDKINQLIVRSFDDEYVKEHGTGYYMYGTPLRK